MTRRCTDCGDITRVDDFDSPAVCGACVGERREVERSVRENPQAGAQFVGRERGTRDVR